MPKLLIINVTCNQGSTGKISEQIGALMKSAGWDVYLAHGARRVNPSGLNTFQFSSVKDEYLHFVKSLFFDSDGLGSIVATKRLVNYIKDIKPDIIQLHNLHGYYINYKVLFGYLNKTQIPVVMTLHDCWSFTGHCVHPIIANCNKWKTECNHCPLKNKYPKKTIGLDRSKRNLLLKQRYIASYKNLHIVAVSNWLSSWLKQSIFRAKPIKIIHNGIDLNTFKPCERTNSNKYRVLGVSNVWLNDKGLLDIFKLRALLPLEKYQITLVGLSQEQVKKLPEGIVGITRTSNQQELAKLYSDADVLVNPTYADTFPTVNLEALACGTPVVTYRTGGSPEALTPETGIVVERGDVKEMADAIMTTLTKTKETIDACRQRAVSNYDKDVCFLEYAKLYSELISKH